MSKDIVDSVPGATLKRRLTLEPGGGLTHVKDPRKSAKAETVAEKDIPIPTGLKFAFGSISAMSATFFTHPIDVVKYRMQLDGKSGKAGHANSFACGASILRAEGPGGLFKGLTASMMRQLSYGTTRLGIYTSLMESFQSADGSPPPLYQKLGFSMTAGGIGAMVGNPFDLALVRMASDSTLPVEKRRNYKNAMEAVYRIVRSEGVMALWIGCGPTVSRCVVLNIAQLTTYSQAKEELLKTPYFDDNIYCHLASSMISGFVATAVSTPFDVAKTRIQQDALNEYKGMADCLMQTARSEGVLSLWKGFTPAYLRLAPQTVLIFVFLEQINKAYKKYKLK